ncbi:MAG: hypothetical protein L0K12_08060 [Brevibacterium aurantiacum]|nr:hypothetical protein [Brevibacterium aurantiacum]
MADISCLADTESMLARVSFRITQLNDYGLTFHDVFDNLGYSKTEWGQMILLGFTLGQLRDLAQALFVSPEWLLTDTPEPGELDPVEVRRRYCRCVNLMYLSAPDCPIHGRSHTTRSPYQLDMGSRWAIEIETQLSRRLDELGIHESELAEAHVFDPRTWGELKVSARGYGAETVEPFLAAIRPEGPTMNGDLFS